MFVYMATDRELMLEIEGCTACYRAVSEVLWNLPADIYVKQTEQSILNV